MAYACKVLADSISPAGHRLTSFEVTFPRIVLAEMNTHCMFGRNSASSRAIPVPKRIAALVEDPFVPEAFGRNQKGMQPGEALEGDDDIGARATWINATHEMIRSADKLAKIGVHKQYANRLLEPFSWHTAVITATDFHNFFNLRVNSMAQGELEKAARIMRDARAASEPRMLNYGEWHLPYVEPGEAWDLEVGQAGIAGVWKVSVGRCARVSYLTQNGVRDPAEDVALADRLLGSGHMSPFEHVARPMVEFELALTLCFDVALEAGPTLRWKWGDGPPPVVGDTIYVAGRDVTIAYVRGPLHYAGKLNGWISRRQFIYGEHDILGHRER